MKIVFVSTDKNIIINQNGDVYNRHQKYARYFEKLTVIIFSLKKDQLIEKNWENLKLVPTNSNSKWEYVTDSLKILSHLEKPDLISTQDPFITAVIGVVSKIWWRVKLNIQIHNDYFESKYFRQERLQNHVFYWLGRFNLIFADNIRVVSKRLKTWKKAFVAPVAVDLDYFWDKPHKNRYGQIVTVARLAKQKNLSLLVNVAKNLIILYPELRFVIVGEGPERRDVEQKILTNGLEKNVFLFGQKSRPQIKKIFAKSDLYLQTSNYEGWGLAIIEAISSGLSVVMTDTGCAGEMVRNEKIGGLITPVNNIVEMVSAVKTILTDNKLSHRLVQHGQEQLRRNYTPAQLIHTMVSNLKKTI